MRGITGIFDRANPSTQTRLTFLRGAFPFTRGDTVARIFQQRYTVGGETRKTKVWYAQYRDERGRRVVESTGCRDKASARLWLANAVATCERIRAGVLTREQADAARGRVRHGVEPLTAHVAAFVEHLESQKRSASWIKQIRNVFARLGVEAKWQHLEDITYDSYDAWARANLVESSARVKNYYRGAVTAFFDWAARCGRATSSPLASYPVANVEADRRYIRRAFTRDELVRLIEATPDEGRALAYRLMALTGLRFGECRDLVVGDVILDKLPRVRLPAKYAKNRTRADLPLRSDLAAMLAPWIKGRGNGEPLFALPRSKPHVTFAKDMDAAGIPRIDAGGRHLDLHSFRYTFNTAFARAGVEPRVAQEAMRHTDPRLTAMVYTDPALLRVAEAVESLDLLR